MNDSTIPGRKVGELQDDCFEIELTKDDLETLKLDESYVLLELRHYRNEYGVYYTAKGRQWDLRSDPEEAVEHDKGVSFAMRDPIGAAVELLSRKWRPDFDYDPDEED